MKSPLCSLALAAIVFTSSLFVLHNLYGQESGDGSRKILTRVSPQYPELARSMHLEGSVRAEITVAPNGTVKSLDIKGGHPLFVQAGQNALRQWKWEPAARETHETVELKFSL